MADFKKSVDALQFIKDLSMPQQAGKIIKASDAYAPFADQGIFTAPTMADRTIASPKGKLKGGMRFPYLQNVDPAYEGEVWGFGAGNMSTKLLNQFENVPADKLLLSTILGNKYMHHSNPEVSAELIKHYRKGIKDKKLSTELRDVTNRRINQLTDEDGNPIFAPDSDVTDPAFYRSLDTFDKRAAMGNIMGGVGLNEGAERKRRVANQIFDYEGLMRKMTEPSIIGAPNSSIGSRIFTLSGTKSERPDLNKAYPHVVGGLDLNVDFGQVPFQHYLKDYTDNMMQTRGKVPGWFNLTRSSDLPTQEITDQWLQHLKNQGYAEGGEVEHMQAGGIKKAVGALGELTQAAPKKITHGMLRRRGMEIGNKEEADALYSSGHRIFGMHELDEVPFEITDRKLFDSYAPDMMLAYPPDKPILKADGGGVEHMQAGGLKTLMGEVLNKGGTYAARRLERAADEIPNLEKLFQEQALQRAFLGDNARALMTIKPSDFENYATPIGDLLPSSASNIVDLIGIKNSGGYKDVPFLEVNKKLQGSTGLPFISGHEGRHRNRAMDQSGEQASLVQFLPRSELREPFERRYQDQYINALRQEMALTGNKVMPQKYYEDVKDPLGRIVETRDIQRPVIDLPDLYAEGGAVHSQIGGMTPEPAGGSARQQTFESEHMAEGGDIMRQLFDHALEKGDIHDMTHALLVQQHEAEHG